MSKEICAFWFLLETIVVMVAHRRDASTINVMLIRGMKKRLKAVKMRHRHITKKRILEVETSLRSYSCKKLIHCNVVWNYFEDTLITRGEMVLLRDHTSIAICWNYFKWLSVMCLTFKPIPNQWMHTQPWFILRASYCTS